MSPVFPTHPPPPFQRPLPQHPWGTATPHVVKIVFETQTQKSPSLGQTVRPQACLDCRPKADVLVAGRGPGQGWLSSKPDPRLLSLTLAPCPAPTQPPCKWPSKLTEQLLGCPVWECQHTRGSVTFSVLPSIERSGRCANFVLPDRSRVFLDIHFVIDSDLPFWDEATQPMPCQGAL